MTKPDTNEKYPEHPTQDPYSQNYDVADLLSHISSTISQWQNHWSFMEYQTNPPDYAPRVHVGLLDVRSTLWELDHWLAKDQWDNYQEY